MDEEVNRLISQTDDSYGTVENLDGGGDITHYHKEESVLVSISLHFHFLFI